MRRCNVGQKREYTSGEKRTRLKGRRYNPLTFAPKELLVTGARALPLTGQEIHEAGREGMMGPLCTKLRGEHRGGGK